MCPTLVLFVCSTLVLFMCSTLVLFVCSTLVLFVCTTLVVFMCTTLVIFVCTTNSHWGVTERGHVKEKHHIKLFLVFNFSAPVIYSRTLAVPIEHS